MVASFWTDARNEELRRLLAEGKSLSATAAALGISRGAVSGRKHRALLRTAFPYMARRRQEKAAARARRQAAIDLIVGRCASAIAAGEDRIVAILRAYDRGASSGQIGRAIGITGGRVRQLIAQHRASR